ncbi:hypothetical protein [Streptomyces chattanoogensis]|uniref:hypothetical protein n=1 Tax=Streptomyces chattanoogensis TaxID=66876 RepID=UPI000ABDDBDD|nr:hypothetical protein [Streptomyces chattanoogensis]
MPGPVTAHDGPVLVSLTDFTLTRFTDLPGVYRAARRLTTEWPGLEGAVGVWLWAAPTARRCGAVAVWRDEAALQGFVSWPPHVAIMRRYRGRGSLTSATWTADRCDPYEIWARARGVLRPYARRPAGSRRAGHS